jgi:hypothetical protein
MAEQLRMALHPETPDTRHHPARHDLAAPIGRRRRPPVNRPVRGEPDLPDSGPRPGEWRMDESTRLAGLQGIARARGALVATAPPGSDRPGAERPGHHRSEGQVQDRRQVDAA